MKQIVEILLIIAKKLTGIGALIIFIWFATCATAYFVVKEYWKHQEAVSEARFQYFKSEKNNIYDLIHDQKLRIDTLIKLSKQTGE